MRGLLRRMGLAGPPPAALHRKWLDTLCRPPPEAAGRVPGEGRAPSDPADPLGGESLGPARGRPRPTTALTRFLLGPPKH